MSEVKDEKNINSGENVKNEKNDGNNVKDELFVFIRLMPSNKTIIFVGNSKSTGQNLNLWLAEKFGCEVDDLNWWPMYFNGWKYYIPDDVSAKSMHLFTFTLCGREANIGISDSDGEECCVCLNAYTNARGGNCSHRAVVCKSCAKNLTTCPVCKVDTEFQ